MCIMGHVRNVLINQEGWVKMSQAKFMYLFGTILYTVIAFCSSKFFEIHWIHILNTLMLSSILFNLLDWKYWEEVNNG